MGAGSPARLVEETDLVMEYSSAPGILRPALGTVDVRVADFGKYIS
jgi:hypothetical protein